jgi:hypothetical protein
MRTKTETMADQHGRMLDALADLEEQAVALCSPAANDYAKRAARTRLAAAALVYAARVRRLAGVR